MSQAAIDLVLSILEADKRLLPRDDIIAIAERALGEARREERERIINELRDRVASPYSEQAAVITRLIAELR